VREDGLVAQLHPIASVVEHSSGILQTISNDWWAALVFFLVFGGSIREAFRRHHRRRLAILAAKAELAESRNAAALPPPEPQPICGCSHHLSFHNPATSSCAVDDCRCQQYVGPEPLGHVVALPLVDPERMTSPPLLDHGQPDGQQA
jgi:hypothetical protein